MNEDSKTQREVTLTQLNDLLKFMKDNPGLAKQSTTSSCENLETLKLWNLCAKELNADKDGATKDGKGWLKYWCDWKCRLRHRALELKNAKMSNNLPLKGVEPLSHLEEDILNIIGDSADEVSAEADRVGNAEEEGGYIQFIGYRAIPSTSTNYTVFSSYPRGRKRRHSCTDVREVQELVLQSPQHAMQQNVQESVMRQQNCKQRRHSFSSVQDKDVFVEPSNVERIRQDLRGKLVAIDISGRDDYAAEFLRLEREKMHDANLIRETLQEIGTEITRMVQIMTTLRDVLINNRIHL